MIPGAWNGAVEIRPALPLTVKVPTFETSDTVSQ